MYGTEQWKNIIYLAQQIGHKEAYLSVAVKCYNLEKCV
jgi:hypothetical protein